MKEKEERRKKKDERKRRKKKEERGKKKEERGKRKRERRKKKEGSRKKKEEERRKKKEERRKKKEDKRKKKWSARTAETIKTDIFAVCEARQLKPPIATTHSGGPYLYYALQIKHNWCARQIYRNNPPSATANSFSGSMGPPVAREPSVAHIRLDSSWS